MQFKLTYGSSSVSFSVPEADLPKDMPLITPRKVAPTKEMADIEGSMNWYNKCDNGLIVARDPSASSCRVISAKVREIGAGRRGECHFYVDEKTGVFTPQHGAVTP